MAHHATPTKFGRVHVAEPLSSLFLVHTRDPAVTPRAVIHKTGTPVLDQEDLQAQGINTAELIKGAARVDALGSCVANATTAALSTLGAATAEQLAAALPGAQLAPGAAVADEETAIRLYHAFTSQTGQAASEWPPADCGSSGLWACRWLEARKIISGHRIATGAASIVSALQDHVLITGQPWLAAWTNPGPDGVIDGDGTPASLSAALDAGGVAGGHETCWLGVESLALDADGEVDPAHTIIRFRNSWGPGWGPLQGDGLAHLSTFIYLSKWCDHRVLLPAS